MNEGAWQSSDVSGLLAHALAIEDEACARYRDLADQMDVHNNPAAARFFRRMAKLEHLHAEKIRTQIGAHAMPQIAPWEYKWLDPEAPETTDFAVVDHMLPLARALQLALHNEQRACAYFLAIERAATDSGVRDLARELADDERQHMEWLARELQDGALHTAPPRTDLDPPLAQE
jgi:rubrerythrin